MANAEGISRKELLVRIWDGSENSKVVDVTVHHLRKALSFCDTEGIIAVPHGYKLIG